MGGNGDTSVTWILCLIAQTAASPRAGIPLELPGWNGVWTSVPGPWEHFIACSKNLALPWHQAGGGKCEKGAWHQSCAFGASLMVGARGFLPVGRIGLAGGCVLGGEVERILLSSSDSVWPPMQSPV